MPIIYQICSKFRDSEWTQFMLSWSLYLSGGHRLISKFVYKSLSMNAAYKVSIRLNYEFDKVPPILCYTFEYTLLYLKLNAFPWKKEREAWLECGWAARKKERLNMRLSLKTFREWLLEGRAWGVLWIEGEFWAEKGLCFSLSLSCLMCSLWIYVSYLLKSQSYLHSICLNVTLAPHLGEKVSE